MRRIPVVLVMLSVGCTEPRTAPATRPDRIPDAAPPSPAPAGAAGWSGTLVAVGDIACAPGEPKTRITCHQAGTAALLERGGPLDRDEVRGVLLLGDIQYERGLPEEYRSFEASWGWRLRRLGVTVLPVAGNHEYGGEGGPPQGCRLVAGERHACELLARFAALTDVLDDGDAQYAMTFGEGERHPLVVIAVDVGRCEAVPEDCGIGGPVVGFLRAALSDPGANPSRACTVVAWHQARWSEVGHGDLPVVDPVWRALFDVPGPQRPDLVVNGHDHVYERYPPLGPTGEPDRSGIAEIVAGTGGKSIGGLPIVTPPLGDLAAIDASSFGVLLLRWSGGDGRLQTSFLTESGHVRDPAGHTCRT